MEIGDKYYRKYLALARCGVDQRSTSIAAVSHSSTDDGYGDGGSSFATWKSHLQERYAFQILIISPHCNEILCMLFYSLASHTLQSPRERGSGNFTYIELCCWNAIMDRFT